MIGPNEQKKNDENMKNMKIWKEMKRKWKYGNVWKCCGQHWGNVKRVILNFINECFFKFYIINTPPGLKKESSLNSKSYILFLGWKKRTKNRRKGW